MSPALLHLMLNHVPLFAVLFAIPLLTLGLKRGSVDLAIAGFGLGILAALGGWAAAASGEGAEEVVEELRTVSEDVIEHHEEAAEVAVWFAGALGVVSAVGLVLSLRSGAVPKGVSWIALGLAVATVAVVSRTAWLGGMIGHPEAHSDVPGAHQDVGSVDERPSLGLG